MQAFARWTNLSETTFLLRADRPGGRLPRAHLHARRRAAVRRPSDARQLPRLARARRRAEGRRSRSCSNAASAWCDIRAEAGRTAFAAPPLAHGGGRGADCSPQVLRGAGAGAAARCVASQWLDNGPRWLGLLLRDAAAVLALAPDHAALQRPRQGRRRRRRIRRVGVRVRGARRSRRWSASPRIRSPAASTPASPQWLIGSGRAPERYVAAQGAKLGRAGRVHVSREDGRYLDRRQQRQLHPRRGPLVSEAPRWRSSPITSSSPRARSRRARRGAKRRSASTPGRRRPARD